ncbi:MAG: cytochrome d ubiquinol oxidase subunit II [Rickettsiaceae bacterium]|nr:cytochrome d ubiquinol oxidase subunit II [Rickettsiaceae bacterium]
MLDFSSWLDLPLIWGFLIATAVFLYALLDGSDLVPALYLPVIFMLLGLIFRGVAFEFRFKSSEEHRKIWDIAFHAGSLLAAFMQGVILGNFVQGIEVNGRSFAGGPLDWANGFSIVTGLSLIFGYALLGATWLIMKTEDITQSWARGIASYVLVYVGLAMAIVSISMPFIDKRIIELWFSLPNFFYLLPIPLFTALGFVLLWKDLKSSNEVRPFFLTIVLFFLSYLGIGISLYPWIVPFKFTIWEAAAVSTSQSLLLVGVIIFLPIILIYTAYSYYVFRGKTSHERMY